MATTPNFPGAPRLGIVTIVPADTTNNKALFAAGSSGSKVVSVTIQSSDSANRDVRLSILRGGVTFPLTQLNVPLNSGNTNAVPPVAALQTSQSGGTPSSPTGILPIDQDGQVYILLNSGDVLQINAPVAVTAATQITAFALGCDF
jgi:hypothetical protein